MAETFGGDCSAYCAAIGVPFDGQCCTSCQSDEEDGYDACESYVGGMWFMTCCHHANLKPCSSQPTPETT